jgi:hypothetical protein
VHPILTEAVTNVAGRSDLLAGAAVLGGVLIYLQSAEAVGWRRTSWLTALALIAAAGASAKESAVVLPVVIALYEIVWWRRDQIRPLLFGCAVATSAIAVVLLQRWYVLHVSLPAETPFGDNPIVAAGFWQGRLTALSVLARYLWLAAWPKTLSADYSFSQIPLATGTPLEWLSWITVAGAAAALLIAFRRNKAVFFLGAFAFLSILPASNLVITTGSIMGERLLYLPLVGLLTIAAMVIEAGCRRLPKPAIPGVCIFLIVVVLYSARTSMRNLDWRDEHTLAAVGVWTSPYSHKVHRELAMDLLRNDPSPSSVDRVVAEADRSIAILAAVPDDINPWNTWRDAAIAHLARAEARPCSGAETEWQTCLPAAGDASYIDSERAAYLATRAAEMESAGRNAFNRRHGTNIQPAARLAECYSILGRASLHIGKPSAALAAALRAKTMAPDSPQAYAEIAEADLLNRQQREAAITLAEGIFITRNTGLRDRLAKLYLNGYDRLGCAVRPGPNGPTVDPACETVRSDFCTAASRMNRPEMSAEFSCSDRKRGS